MNFQRPPSVNSKISKVLEKPSGPHHKTNKSADEKARYISFGVYGKFLGKRSFRAVYTDAVKGPLTLVDRNLQGQ